MNSTTFLLRTAIFTTRQFASMGNSSVDAASRKLRRLANGTDIVRITRGLWCQPDHPRFSAFAAVPFLLGNEHGYVSFLSAMHRHGLLTQIPGGIQVATTGHARTLTSRIGRFELIRIRPQMMLEGIGTSDTDPPYGIATAEKALLDTLYIGTRKGRRFTRLPELDLVDLNGKKLFALLDAQVDSPQIHRSIETRLATLGVRR